MEEEVKGINLVVNHLKTGFVENLSAWKGTVAVTPHLRRQWGTALRHDVVVDWTNVNKKVREWRVGKWILWFSPKSNKNSISCLTITPDISKRIGLSLTGRLLNFHVLLKLWNPLLQDPFLRTNLNSTPETSYLICRPLDIRQGRKFVLTKTLGRWFLFRLLKWNVKDVRRKANYRLWGVQLFPPCSPFLCLK